MEANSVTLASAISLFRAATSSSIAPIIPIIRFSSCYAFLLCDSRTFPLSDCLFAIITNISCYPVHYPLPHAQMSSIDTALLYLCIPLCIPLCTLFHTYDVTGLLHCYAVPAILEHLKLP